MYPLGSVCLTAKLKDRKACRRIDIESRFIKRANPVISIF